jgi:hypothetical protein
MPRMQAGVHVSVKWRFEEISIGFHRLACLAHAFESTALIRFHLKNGSRLWPIQGRSEQPCEGKRCKSGVRLILTCNLHELHARLNQA